MLGPCLHGKVWVWRREAAISYCPQRWQSAELVRLGMFVRLGKGQEEAPDSSSAHRGISPTQAYPSVCDVAVCAVLVGSCACSIYMAP